MGMIEHSQITQSNKFVIPLQYLKKEVSDGGFLHADKHQSFYIILKSVTTAFVFFCDAKHLDILRGSNHVCCYLLIQRFQLI